MQVGPARSERAVPVHELLHPAHPEPAARVAQEDGRGILGARPRVSQLVPLTEIGAEGFRGRELTEEEKVPVLRAYLRRWKAEVGVFFEGVGPDSTDEELGAIAPRHPVFSLSPAQP